ncbi:twitching motility protein PilT [Intrasporangium chromatireducens Q5-1]|uniref:Twitching motility protein PilT n=1 Tax=Intrasporangium chromatireducens Q5-1 TaxID=584657 RepID=W9GEW9_9MICO|nr:twitching motility protein PilT [Intrasporangium chromatireducens Q5-1]
MAGGTSVLFDWTVVLACARLSTMARLFDNPLSAAQAADQVRAWLEQPGAEIIRPAVDHLHRVAELLTEARTRGNLNDAHLAALSLQARLTQAFSPLVLTPLRRTVRSRVSGSVDRPARSRPSS